MLKMNLKKEISTLKIGLKEIYKLQIWILPVTIFDALFKSLAPFINIYMSARIIDELLGMKNTDKLLFLVGITIVLNLVIHLVSNGLGHLVNMLKSEVTHNQNMRLNEKIIIMDYEQVENPEVHSLHRKISEARNINNGGIHALIEFLGDFVKGLVAVITSIILVANLFKSKVEIGGQLGFINSRVSSYGFLILILVGVIFSLKLKTNFDKSLFQSFVKFVDLNRLYGYYFGKILDYNVGKDIRLCNQKSLLRKETEGFSKGSQKLFEDFGHIEAKYRALDAFISSSLSGAIYFFVALKVIWGAITIGSIVQYVGGINQFMIGCKSFLTAVNGVINNNEYLQLYIDFLNIEDKNHKGTLPVEKRDDDEYEIQFKNVSFKYPGTESCALKNLSIKLIIGERLAIVGMNGSGKTTFIKLLCRLYDPNEGEILLNGINIKKYDYEEYMRLFSIVFQDFKLFSFSLGQNVATSLVYDEKVVEEVLDKAGLEKRLETMPKGVHTSLYKDFDENGVDISGGEAQKIALARALHRDAPIIILDEPTAALDPISEFEIYSKFNEIVGTKTAFYISHRLSSCRFCDEIAVFNSGEIVQKGSHEELLKDKEGKYYELWYSQAKYYNDEASI